MEGGAAKNGTRFSRDLSLGSSLRPAASACDSLFGQQLAKGRNERTRAAGLKRGEAAARRRLRRRTVRQETVYENLSSGRSCGCRCLRCRNRRLADLCKGNPCCPQPSGGGIEPSGELQPSAKGRLRAAALTCGFFTRVEACGSRMMRTRNAGLRKREASARRTCVRFPYSGCGLPTSARSKRDLARKPPPIFNS